MKPTITAAGTLLEAVAFTRGSNFMLPAPDLAEPRHALALLNLAYWLEQFNIEEN